MCITKKTEYALRALYEIDSKQVDKLVSIREICDKQNLPVKYIEQIFRKLKRSKIICSLKGTKGGYTFIPSPKEINLHEIMRALDDKINDLHCEKNQYCNNLPCGFQNFVSEVNTKIIEYFSSITLDKIFLKIKEVEGE